MKMHVIALVGTLALSACGTTIRPGQRGIKYFPFSKPGLQEKVLREGYYFQWPWNSIVVYDIRWRSSTEEVEVLTRDDLHVTTRVTVTFRPDDRQLRRLVTEIGPDYYDKVVRPPFVTIARSEFARHQHSAMPEDSPAIEKAILDQLRRSLRGKPILVDRVAINHVAYDRTVTDSISKKLATEQSAEQKRFERQIAEQDAEIARTRARGEADSIEIRATGEGRAIESRAAGEAQAIELRGRAQAQAQLAIGKTLTTRYLQFKAFDNPAGRYYFVPVGRNGMPLFLNVGAEPSGQNRELTLSSAQP